MSDDSNNSEVSLERVLCLLDRWRHLPAYQLERRVDVIFALFLPEVLEKHFGASDLRLIPEFPIKKSLLPAYRGDITSQSINVDFLAVEKVEDGGRAGRAFLVELKTDMASKGEEQARDLGQAVEKGLKELVVGAIQIAGATNHKQKYVHLLKMLADLGLVEYDSALFPVKPGYSKTLAAVKTKAEQRQVWPSLELVYVQPRRPKMAIIDFNEFSETIAQGGPDGIRKMFASYLQEWAAKDAGDRNPKDREPC